MSKLNLFLLGSLAMAQSFFTLGVAIVTIYLYLQKARKGDILARHIVAVAISYFGLTLLTAVSLWYEHPFDILRTVSRFVAYALGDYGLLMILGHTQDAVKRAKYGPWTRRKDDIGG
jgi:hypothetical protein